MRKWLVGVVVALAVVVTASRVVLGQGPFNAQIQAFYQFLMSTPQTITGNWTCTGTCVGFGAGGGGVTSVGTASPITGGPIVATGTIACATCGVTGSPLSQFAATTSAQLAGVISNETGTGALVFGTAPTITLANGTGLPIGTGVSGLGTGVATALAVNIGSAGAPVLFNGALGTPSSGVATNLTGTAAGLTAGVASAVAVGGVTGLGTGVATFLATPTSANLAAAVTDETGTGVLVLATSPTLVTPVLGVASATSLAMTATTTLSGTTGLDLEFPSDGSGVQLNVQPNNLYLQAVGSGISAYSDTDITLNSDATLGVLAGTTLTLSAPTIITLASPNVLNDSTWTSLATGTHKNQFQIIGRYDANDGVSADGLNVLSVQNTYGASTAGKGTLASIVSDITVTGNALSTSEYVTYYADNNVKIGTGFAQTAGPAGAPWLSDWNVNGPIAVQPAKFVGQSVVANNFYNGSPSLSTASAYWATAARALATDATHAAAASYPLDVAYGCTGTTSAGSQNGFTVCLQIGGGGGPYGDSVTTSKIGTGVDIRDHGTRGIYIHNPNGTPTAIEATAGAIIFGDLATTGAATGKTIVCADTNGKLYRSSSGVACAN